MAVLIREKSSTKLAALFPSETAASDALTAAAGAAGIGPAQARLLTPADARASRRELFGVKVQPESTGIARTFFRAHLVLGLIGAAIGALAGHAVFDREPSASEKQIIFTIGVTALAAKMAAEDGVWKF